MISKENKELAEKLAMQAYPPYMVASDIYHHDVLDYDMNAEKRETFKAGIELGLQALNDAGIEVSIRQDAKRKRDNSLSKELLEEGKERIKKQREELHAKGILLEDFCGSETCAYRGNEICLCKTSDFCPMFEEKT